MGRLVPRFFREARAVLSALQARNARSAILLARSAFNVIHSKRLVLKSKALLRSKKGPAPRERGRA